MLIQEVFYWAGAIAFILIGLFMLVSIIFVLYIKAQVSKISRVTQEAAMEARMAMEAAKSRARGWGAEVASNLLGGLLAFLKKK